MVFQERGVSSSVGCAAVVLVGYFRLRWHPAARNLVLAAFILGLVKWRIVRTDGTMFCARRGRYVSSIADAAMKATLRKLLLLPP